MLSLRILFFLAGGALASFYPFLSALLASRGFSPAEVGAATALTSLAYTVAAPVWGHLGDVVLGRARALRIASIAAAVVLLGLLIPDASAPFTVAILAVFFLFEAALGPLSDAVAINALGERLREFPKVRIVMSLSFSIAVVSLGLLYDRLGFALIPIAFAIAMTGVAWIAGRIPDAERLRMPSRAAGRRTAFRPSGGSFRLALAIQPRLRPLLLGLGLVHVGILSAFTFLSLRILDLGGRPSEIALGSGLAAAAEIPAMAVVGVVAARVGLRWLVAGGAAAYAVALVAWAVLDAIPAIIVVRGLTGVAFAAITIGAVMAIASLLPSRLQATGQGLFATVAFGLAAIVASAVGGVVYTAGGHVPLFLGSSVTVLVGIVVMWRALPARNETVRVPGIPEAAEGIPVD